MRNNNGTRRSSIKPIATDRPVSKQRRSVLIVFPIILFLRPNYSIRKIRRRVYKHFHSEIRGFNISPPHSQNFSVILSILLSGISKKNGER
jgi:hypothetical protein